MNELLEIIATLEIGLFFKFAVAILILLYATFTLILYNHIRSLKRIVIIKHSIGGAFVQSFGLIYFLASAILFILCLVIL